MTPEEQQYLMDLKTQANLNAMEAQGSKNQYGAATASSMFSQADRSNLIEWQLNLNEELERIENILRGRILTRERGVEKWVEGPEQYRSFNEFGVQQLMKVIVLYLNKNTLLSNYDDKTINFKMQKLGHQVKDLLFMSYEEMGMDTELKRKQYLIIINEIIDVVHSAYLRALNGEERTSLTTSRFVQQSENMQPQMMVPPVQRQSFMSRFNPLNLLRA